ncbi:hypothetical protein JHK82_043753 [Glycine max]|nr:hypothetical protein JHK82_043753 [Glycine max]
MVQEVEDLIGEMEKAFVSVDGHCVLEKGLSEEAEDVFYKERNLAGWKKDVLECNFMIQSSFMHSRNSFFAASWSSPLLAQINPKPGSGSVVRIIREELFFLLPNLINACTQE